MKVVPRKARSSAVVAVQSPTPMNVSEILVAVRLEWESMQQMIRETRDLNRDDLAGTLRSVACAFLRAADDLEVLVKEKQ